MKYLSFCTLVAVVAVSSAGLPEQWSRLFQHQKEPEVALVSLGGISNWWPEVKSQALNTRPASRGKIRIQKIYDKNGKIYLSKPKPLESFQLKNLLNRVAHIEAQSAKKAHLRGNAIQMQWTPAEKNKLKKTLADLATDGESSGEAKDQTFVDATAITKQLDTLKNLLDRLIEIVVKNGLGHLPIDDGPQNRVKDNFADLVKLRATDSDEEVDDVVKEYFNQGIFRPIPKVAVAKQHKSEVKITNQQKFADFSMSELESLKQYLDSAVEDLAVERLRAQDSSELVNDLVNEYFDELNAKLAVAKQPKSVAKPPKSVAKQPKSEVKIRNQHKLADFSMPELESLKQYLEAAVEDLAVDRLTAHDSTEEVNDFVNTYFDQVDAEPAVAKQPKSKDKIRKQQKSTDFSKPELDGLNQYLDSAADELVGQRLKADNFAEKVEDIVKKYLDQANAELAVAKHPENPVKIRKLQKLANYSLPELDSLKQYLDSAAEELAGQRHEKPKLEYKLSELIS